MRGLSIGSTSARASGWRARMRRNRPSSVGWGLFWITGLLFARLSLWCRFGFLPPGFGQVSGQRGYRRPFYPIPPGDPLLFEVIKRNRIAARHQYPVERPHRRDEIGAVV